MSKSHYSQTGIRALKAVGITDSQVGMELSLPISFWGEKKRGEDFPCDCGFMRIKSERKIG